MGDHSEDAVGTPAAAPARSPNMSPVLAGKPGRTKRIRDKVLEEFRNVTRKSSVPAAPSMGLERGSSAGELTPLPRLSGGPPAMMLNPVEMEESDNEDPGVPHPVAKGKGCVLCERSFTVFRPKHTCKLCSKRICDDCSKNRVKLNLRAERKRGSRVCDTCARGFLSGTVGAPEASPPESPKRRDTLVFAEPTEEASSEDHHEKVAAPSSSSTLGAMAIKVKGPATAAAAAAKQLRSTVLKKDGPETIHASHLRLRHYFSLAVISGILLLRVAVTNAVRPPPVGPGEARNVENVSIVLAPLFLLARLLENVANVRMIGSYVLGLVVFEEVKRLQRRQKAPKQVTKIEIRRRRTVSSLSESARRAAGLPPTPPLSTTSVAMVPHQEDEEVLEVDTGDKMEEDDSFHFDKLVNSLAACVVKERTETGDLKVSPFLFMCDYTCGFISVFGRATSFAASTVNGYIGTIGTNLAGWPAPTSGALSWKEMSVRAVIEYEVEHNLATVGGKKKPSCCRCVLRLLWFLEFVEASMRYTLVESTDENCTPGASKAYEETIGTRHPWLIRKGVMSALGSIPTRSAIVAALNIGGSSAPSEELVMTNLRQSQAHMQVVMDELRRCLKEHDLLDLK
ncbi:TPA: hypothetical protein N0F65_010898 [Lagenidium giganteum]|uniref:FYVE-type domain-containing protein n=1 Tax=Lagenidium giganteum TaxID=4803 RepID=A0AAV2YJR1_9STRA|nr:TPA: hypothetical protein N0F65_010898 [Lagenidium giganteum]